VKSSSKPTREAGQDALAYWDGDAEGKALTVAS
jgi:hypothetical protein